MFYVFRGTFGDLKVNGQHIEDSRMTRLGHLRVFNFITLVLFLLSCYFCVQGDSGDDKRRTAVVAVASDDFDDRERTGDEEDASVEEEFDPEDLEVFMPTDTWQTIKAGWLVGWSVTPPPPFPLSFLVVGPWFE